MILDIFEDAEMLFFIFEKLFEELLRDLVFLFCADDCRLVVHLMASFSKVISVANISAIFRPFLVTLSGLLVATPSRNKIH
jgi:hypothetical protein